MEKIHYPSTRKIDQIDDYHGNQIPDPYRWLEDTYSPETNAWIEAQNKVTQTFLENLPAKDRIRERLTELWNYPRSLAPQKVKGRYFQLRNSGLQNQDVLYVMDSLDGDKRVLLDPNELSLDGTVSLTNWEISKNGDLLAYATNTSGSDWQLWRVRDVDTGEDFADKIEWSKFSDATWHPDTSGFFYCGYDPPEEGGTYESVNINQKVFFHRLGTDQSEDQLIFHRLDQPEWGYDPIISEDGNRREPAS